MAIIVGTNSDDVLNGTSGDDTITGLGGNDVINAGDGSDDIDGGAGDDALSGGLGGDIYRFGLGGGSDVITETGGSDAGVDILQLDDAVAKSKVIVRGDLREAGDGLHYDLLVELTDGAGQVTDTIRLADQLSPGAPQVELLRLRQVELDLAAPTGWNQRGTSGNEAFAGSQYGDTYHLESGVGQDQVQEQGLHLLSGDPVDILELGVGLKTNDLVIRGQLRTDANGDHYDLLIGIQGENGQITDSILLRDQLTQGAPQVEQLTFANSLSAPVNLAAGLNMRGLTAHSRIPDGDHSYDDVFYGSLLGDTYHLGPHIGHDAVIERGGAGDDKVVVDHRLGPTQILFTTVVREDLDGPHYDLVILDKKTGDSLTILDQFTPGHAQVESLVFADPEFADRKIDLTGGLRLTGSDGDDVIIATDGADKILAGAGDDLVLAVANDPGQANVPGRSAREGDIFEGGDGTGDTLSFTLISTEVDCSLASTRKQSTGGGGKVTCGGFENLDGGDGNDHLLGSKVANILDGGKGDDVLTGGGGADTLRGGSGSDSFVFVSLTDSTTGKADLIQDLANEDFIDVRAIDADPSQAGDQAFSLVAAFTHSAGQATLAYDPSTNLTSLKFDVNGDAVSDMTILIAGDHHDFIDPQHLML